MVLAFKSLGERVAVRRLRLTSWLLVILAASINVGVILTYGPTSDLPAFLHGAELVSRGESPYAPAAPLHNYLYAPWLAYLLIPATWMPFELVAALWHTLLAVSLGASLLPLIRSRSLEGTLAALLVGSLGFHAVWAGHFQPLLMCLLVYALPTRWGPVAIGVAASLKVAPLALAIRFAGRGEWTKVGVAVLVAGALWAPALLLGVSAYDAPIGRTISLLGYSPFAWAAVAGLAMLGAWRLAPTRYGWLAAAVAWLAMSPRMQLYDVSVLLAAAPVPHRRVETERKERPAGPAVRVPIPVSPARTAAVYIEGEPSAVSREAKGIS